VYQDEDVPPHQSEKRDNLKEEIKYPFVTFDPSRLRVKNHRQTRDFAGIIN
jgi:hypothetical protein